MRIEAHGLRVDLPPGWEGRIYRRTPERPDATTHPIMHAGTFSLPEDRGDFGSGAVELMGGDDLFVALVEYEREAAGTALFAKQGLPRPAAGAFSPHKLQRHVPGQAGAQFFFSHRGRAFCLYVVLGSAARREPLVGRVTPVVAAIDVEPGSP